MTLCLLEPDVKTRESDSIYGKVLLDGLIVTSINIKILSLDGMFTLFNAIFGVLAMMVDIILGISFDGIEYGPIYLIYALALFIPGLAVFVRRMHDVGKSGWFILISLVPLIGAIWLLILWCTDGSSEENKYGPSPKS